MNLIFYKNNSVTIFLWKYDVFTKWFEICLHSEDSFIPHNIKLILLSSMLVDWFACLVRLWIL